MTYSSYFKSELLVLFRRKQDLLNAILFFIMVIVLFPLGVSPSSGFLASAAAGIVWCAAVLAILMAIDNMFKEDYRDGTLEQLVVSGLSLPILMLIKVVVYWFVFMLPLVLIIPILSEMLFLPFDSLSILLVTLLLGSPSLFLVGAIGAALTVSLRQGAMLMMLLILPFYLPVIIFATSAVEAVQVGLPYSGALAILSAISLVSLVFSPFMMAISAKASVN